MTLDEIILAPKKAIARIEALEAENAKLRKELFTAASHPVVFPGLAEPVKEATMTDAPERIWAGNAGPDLGDTWFEERVSDWQEYVRADLYEQVKRERDEFRDIAARKSNQVAALIKDGGARVDTGCKDRNGRPIYLGDKVRYRLEGPHTKPEYWNPEYEVIFVPPAFTLKHIGGGKDGGSHDFKLRCGGGNGNLEIIERGPYHTALAEPAGGAEVSELYDWFAKDE